MEITVGINNIELLKRLLAFFNTSGNIYIKGNIAILRV